MAGLFERSYLLVLSMIGRRLQPQVRKNAVLTIHLGRPQLFAVHWDNSVPFLARGFGNKLLEPGAQVGDAG